MKDIITLIIIVSIVFVIASEFCFRFVVLAKRKTKEKAFKLLKNRYNYNIENFKRFNFEDLEIISSDNLKLKAHYINKFNDSNKVVIIAHGYTDNYYISAQFIDMFLNEQFNVLLIEARSHGNSEGKYATYGYYEKQDLDLWVNLIRDKVGEDGVIGIQGQSMGAASALMYAGDNEDKVDFIIADSSYTTAKAYLAFQFHRLAHIPLFPAYQIINMKVKKRCGFSLEQCNPINSIKDKEIPVLFVHGKKDVLVPYTMSIEMYDAKIGNKNKLFIVEDAGHIEAYAKDKVGYEKVVNEFIKEAIN